MTRPSSAGLLQQIHTLFTAGSCHGLSDKQLLERFVTCRDDVAELAFTTLVERHGPMVLGVCRRILADSHEAEDAFQATFLVLVRQAGSIRVDGSLGRWLYGVATRVGARARSNALRRQVRERSGLNRIEAESHDTASNRADLADVQSILNEELNKLPSRFQAAIVLCDLEGSSHEEAALFFGCPVGTVKSRLSRARARLRRGLIRRGLAPPDPSNIIPLFPAALPRGLVEATNQAAQAWILGRLSTTHIVSASVSALTEGVLWTMFLTKLKLTAAALLFIGAGSAVLVSQATAQRLSAPHVAVANPGQMPEGAREAPVSEDVLDLEMLERAWVDAVNRRDMAVVRRIIADDFSTIDSAGNTSNRSDYLLGVLNGVSSNQPIALDEIKTRIFGETAAITSRIKIKTAPSSGRMTNVYVKRLGHWRCVASHTSGVVMRTCPAINTTKRREQLLDQTAASRPSTLATQRTGLSSSCMTCHEASHQTPSGAGQSDANVFYQPYTFKAPRPGQEIRIRPRFECLVERVYVNRGESVKKGAPLIGLSSIELASAKNDYLTKEVQSKHDQRILEMRRKLFATNAISEQALTDAQNNGEKSKLEVQVARDKLKFLGLNDEAIELVGTENGKQKAQLTLRAPMDGTIAKVDAELGNLYDVKSVLLILNATSSGQSTQP